LAVLNFNRAQHIPAADNDGTALRQEGHLQMKLLFAAATAALVGLCSIASANSVGMASFYKSGRITANGEPFNPHGMTAAHRKLPFGTKVRVTNLKNGKSVIVRINDRGPFIGGRVIDLSLGAAKIIGMTHSGVARVSYVIIK
jgi:rare lipoprotein A